MVSQRLVEIFGFSDIYATWLPKHLEYLKQESITILQDLKSDDFELVRYSTIISIDGLKDRNFVNSNVKIL